MSRATPASAIAGDVSAIAAATEAPREVVGDVEASHAAAAAQDATKGEGITAPSPQSILSRWGWVPGRPRKPRARTPSVRPGASSLYSNLVPSDNPEHGAGEHGGYVLGGWMRMGSEAWRRRVSMGIVFFLVLLGDANRGLVLPTLQGYLGHFGGDATSLGLANAGFSLGRLLVAPFYGYWMDKRNAGEVIAFTMVICFVSNLVYTYCAYLDDPALVIIITRTFLGVGASVLGVGRAYIAKQTAKAERGPYIAVLSALQYAGFTLTAFISLIDFKGIEHLSLTKYNLPGFVLSATYLLGLVVLFTTPHTLFQGSKEHVRNTAAAAKQRRAAHYHSPSYPYLLQLEKSQSNDSVSSLLGSPSTEPSPQEGSQPQEGRGELGEGSSHCDPRYREHCALNGCMQPLLGGSDGAPQSQPIPLPAGGEGGLLRRSLTRIMSAQMTVKRSICSVPGIVIVFILLNFAVRAVLATLETLSAYIISYLYTGSTDPKVWSMLGTPERVADTFTAIGLIGLVVFVGVYYMCKRLPDRITLLTGLICILVGLGITLDFHDGEGKGHEMSLTQFEIGLGFVWALGYPLSQTVVVSALSKVLTSEQQGLWMGNLASAGSAGRIVAPTLAGHIYNALHEHTGVIPLSFCFGVTLLATVLVLCVWNRLRQVD